MNFKPNVSLRGYRVMRETTEHLLCVEEWVEKTCVQRLPFGERKCGEQHIHLTIIILYGIPLKMHNELGAQVCLCLGLPGKTSCWGKTSLASQGSELALNSVYEMENHFKCRPGLDASAAIDTHRYGVGIDGCGKHRHNIFL